VEWIEQATLDQVVGEPELPFRSSEAEGAIDFDGKKLTPSDRVLGLAYAGGVFLLWSFAMAICALAFSNGQFPGVVAIVGFYVAAGVYFLTVRRAYQRRKAAESRSDDSM
jgi:hypothetical protein